MTSHIECPRFSRPRSFGKTIAARGLAVLGAALLAGAAVIPAQLHAQTPSISASEAASQSPSLRSVSIAPNTSGGRMTWLPMDDGGVTIQNASVQFLIEFAYQAEDFQITGGPDWIRSAKYDIALKASDPLTRGPHTDLRQQRRALVRAVLQDRFHLKLIEQTRPTPSFALVVASGGPRISPRAVPPGAAIPTSVTAEMGKLTMVGGSNGELARVLSGQLGCPVVDETRLNGVYDLTLLWKTGSQPSLLAAVQEQLGLRLEERVALESTYLVDEVEKPGEVEKPAANLSGSLQAGPLH